MGASINIGKVGFRRVRNGEYVDMTLDTEQRFRCVIEHA